MIIEKFVRMRTKVMESSDNKYIATRWTPKLEINTDTKTPKIPTNYEIDRRIILPFSLFEPMACNCMHCTQLCATLFELKKVMGLQRQTYKIDWTTLGSSGHEFEG